MKIEETVAGRIYKCKVKQAWNGKIEEIRLLRVNEDDVGWRFPDDNAELDERNWDVIEIQLPEGSSQ